MVSTDRILDKPRLSSKIRVDVLWRYVVSLKKVNLRVYRGKLRDKELIQELNKELNRGPDKVPDKDRQIAD